MEENNGKLRTNVFYVIVRRFSTTTSILRKEVRSNTRKIIHSDFWLLTYFDWLDSLDLIHSILYGEAQPSFPYIVYTHDIPPSKANTITCSFTIQYVQLIVHNNNRLAISSYIMLYILCTTVLLNYFTIIMLILAILLTHHNGTYYMHKRGG